MLIEGRVSAAHLFHIYEDKCGEDDLVAADYLLSSAARGYKPALAAFVSSLPTGLSLGDDSELRKSLLHQVLSFGLECLREPETQKIGCLALRAAIQIQPDARISFLLARLDRCGFAGLDHLM